MCVGGGGGVCVGGGGGGREVEGGIVLFMFSVAQTAKKPSIPYF